MELKRDKTAEHKAFAVNALDNFFLRRKRAVLRLMAFLSAFDSGVLGTWLVRLSKLGFNFLSFICTTDWKGICRDSTLDTPSVYHTCERVHTDRETEP